MTKKRIIIFLGLGAVAVLIIAANFFFAGPSGSRVGNTPGGFSGDIAANGGVSSREGVNNGQKWQKKSHFNATSSPAGGEQSSRIQGEQAPEPIYERPKISQIAPLLSQFKENQKENPFFAIFAPSSGKKLSEGEVFDKIWPPKYRTNLKKMEDMLVGDGYIAETERSALDSDEEMFKTLNRVLGYANKKGWVADKDVATLSTGINESFRDLVKRERAALANGMVRRSTLPGDQNIVVKNDNRQKAFFDLVDGLKYVFMVSPSAHASETWVPSWNTTPDCYKDLVAVYPVPGENLWDFCCNCGLLCSYGCTFIEDCGPYSVECNVPLGCLNLICEAWPNAVWDGWTDPLPTGICGCG